MSVDFFVDLLAVDFNLRGLKHFCPYFLAATPSGSGSPGDIVCLIFDFGFVCL